MSKKEQQDKVDKGLNNEQTREYSENIHGGVQESYQSTSELDDSDPPQQDGDSE